MNQSFGSTIDGLNKELNKLGTPSSISQEKQSQEGDSATKKKSNIQIHPTIEEEQMGSAVSK